MVMPTANWVGPLLSLGEDLVLQALFALAPEFKVSPGKKIPLALGPDEHCPRIYRPSFDVCAVEGQEIVLQVMSLASMSFLNLLTFLEVDAQLRATGKGFLILVWDEKKLPSRALLALPQFAALHIVPVRTDVEVITAVKNEIGLTSSFGNNYFA